MRIELNSGGLTGTASLSTMQSEITALLGGADVFLSALRSVKSYTCNINGGVGSLQGALDEVESRIQTAETVSSNLNAAKDKIGSFIELTKTVDLTVSGLVNRNKHEFYNLNEWSRPPQKEEEKEWYEKLYDWACGVGDSIAETAQKAWNGIKSFCSSAKEKLDEWFANFQEWWKDHMTITPISIEDEVYDSNRYTYDPSDNGKHNVYDDDYYGSRQHGPEMDVSSGDKQAIKDYTKIIQDNTGVTLSEQQLREYLDAKFAKDGNGRIKYDSNGEAIVEKVGLNHEGCEYAAIVNTIFEYYIHRENGEREFYNKFGYSLRDADGNLNYNYVLVDVYSKYDDTNFSGLTDQKAEIILESYMGETGKDGNSSVSVDMKTGVHVTVRNIDNYLRSGKQVIMSAQNVVIRDESGNLMQDCAGDGHAMVVTGVTSDGRYIVSTWGMKGYIDPKKQHLNTKLEFSTIEYQN